MGVVQEEPLKVPSARPPPLTPPRTQDRACPILANMMQISGKPEICGEGKSSYASAFASLRPNSSRKTG
ncbi:hypothetical protein JCM2811A_49060 [Methylorubrum rhodinum]